MTISHAIRLLQILLLSVFLTGCGAGCGGVLEGLDSTFRGSHGECRSLGNLDLSVKDSKCEAVFKWNDYNQ